MKKIKIEIKNRFTGSVLFEYETENNTIKKTLEEAIKEKTNLSDADLRNANLWNANLWNADLRNADLRNANLWNANLWNADLRNANLWNANLWNADLRNANLWNANLWNANLRNANLRNADLRNADLRNANLRNANLWNANLSDTNLRNADLRNAVKVPMFCKWPSGITGDKIHIGCEKRTIEEWDEFFNSDKVIETKRDTKEFKQIQAVYEGLRAYYKFLNDGNN